MSSEFTPPGQWAKMTAAQVRKYIREMEEKRRLAQEKLDKARASWEFEKEEEELAKLEDILDNL